MTEFPSHENVRCIAQNQILVICPLLEAVLKKYTAEIDYRPDLSQANRVEWQLSIQEIRPTVIIFNTECITREMMQAWRECVPSVRLAIVRAGSSLSKCDLIAAKFYSIHVFNTPGINSKYVADYMNQILFKQYSSSDQIAIIGVGHIGSSVAIAARKHRVDFVLYNRTKKSNLLRGFGEKLVFAQNLDEAFAEANKIAISLPLDASTQGIITAKIVAKIPQNAMVICVSPLQIFTGDALKLLYSREDVCAIFDDREPELQEIQRIIGDPNPLRDNFILETKAAASSECQNAMTTAAIEKAISFNLLKEDHDSQSCQTKSC